MRVLNPSASCWIDGRQETAGAAVASIGDAGLQAGVGAFETLARHAGRPVEMRAHLDRLADGAASLGLALPAREALSAAIERAAGEAPDRPGWIKIVVTGAGRWFVWSGDVAAERLGSPVSAIVLPWRRSPSDPLLRLKTLSRAGLELGLELARRQGAGEGLWLNTRGLLTEGCQSNVFAVHGSRLFTPAPREGLLDGTVRRAVLRAASDFGVPVHEGKVRPRRLAGAREAFLTSSVLGLRPLVALDGRPIGDGQPGRLTARLASRVAEIRGVAPPA